MDEEVIKKVKEIASKRDSCIFYTDKVVKLHDRGGSDERILVISNLSISFYKIKRSPSQDRIMYWPYITKLSLSENTLSLTFGQDVFRFESTDMDTIMSVIYPILENVLSKEEYENLFLPIPYKTSFDKSIGFLSRFSSCSRKCDIKQSSSLNSAIFRCAKYRSSTLEIPSDCSKISTIEHIFTTLQLVPYVKSLQLPNFSKFDAYMKTADFIINSPYLEHVLFSQTNPKTFTQFCQSLINAPAFNLTGFTFRNSGFKVEHLQNLRDLINIKGIKSISFQNAIDKSAFKFFHEEFFRNLQLKLVSFDRSQSLHVSKLLPFLQNLEYLSVGGCDIDISSFFAAITKTKMNNLKMLNLSVNKCDGPLPADVVFPPKLIRLDLNMIKWKQGLIGPFFNKIACYNWEKGISLGFAQQSASQLDWEILFSSMQSLQANAISSLVWSFNNVDPRFCDFLVRSCYNIDSLTLVSCFTNERPHEIEAFAEALLRLPTLTSLVIAGSETKFMGSSFRPIFKSIKDVGNLRLLDISSNNIGNTGVQMIADLLSDCPALSTVSFDNSKVISIQPLIECLKAVENRLTPTYFGYPENDIAKLVEEKQVPLDVVQLVTAKILSVAKENCKIVNPFFDQPFESFYMEQHIRFPQYVSKEMEQNILSQSSSFYSREEQYLSSGFPQTFNTDDASLCSKSNGNCESSSTFDLWADNSDSELAPTLQFVQRKPVDSSALDHIFDDDTPMISRTRDQLFNNTPAKNTVNLEDDDEIPAKGQVSLADGMKLGSARSNSVNVSLLQFAESSDSEIPEMGETSKSISLAQLKPKPRLSLDSFAESSSESIRNTDDQSLLSSVPQNNTNNANNDIFSDDFPTPDIITSPLNEIKTDSMNLFPQIVTPSESPPVNENRMRGIAALPRRASNYMDNPVKRLIPYADRSPGLSILSRSSEELLKKREKLAESIKRSSASFKLPTYQKIRSDDIVESLNEYKQKRFALDTFDNENKSVRSAPREITQEIDEFNAQSNPQLVPRMRRQRSNSRYNIGPKRWSASKAEMFPTNSSIASFQKQWRNKSVYISSQAFCQSYCSFDDSSVLIDSLKKDLDSDQKWSDEVYVSSEKDSEIFAKREETATIASYDETSGEEQLIPERAYEELRKEHPGIFKKLNMPMMCLGTTSCDDLISLDCSSYNRSIEESALSSSLYFNLFKQSKASGAKNPWISEFQSMSSEEEDNLDDEKGKRDIPSRSTREKALSEGAEKDDHSTIELVEEDENEQYTEYEEEEEVAEEEDGEYADASDDNLEEEEDNEDDAAIHSILIGNGVNQLVNKLQESNIEEEEAPSSNSKSEKQGTQTLGRVEVLESLPNLDSDLSTVSQTIDSESITIDQDDPSSSQRHHRHHHHHHHHKNFEYSTPPSSQSFIKSLPESFKLGDRRRREAPKSFGVGTSSEDGSKCLTVSSPDFNTASRFKESDVEYSSQNERKHRHHHNLELTYKPPDWAFPIQKLALPHTKKLLIEINQKYAFDFLISNIKK